MPRLKDRWLIRGAATTARYRGSRSGHRLRPMRSRSKRELRNTKTACTFCKPPAGASHLVVQEASYHAPAWASVWYPAAHTMRPAGQACNTGACMPCARTGEQVIPGSSYHAPARDSMEYRGLPTMRFSRQAWGTSVFIPCAYQCEHPVQRSSCRAPARASMRVEAHHTGRLDAQAYNTRGSIPCACPPMRSIPGHP